MTELLHDAAWTVFAAMVPVMAGLVVTASVRWIQKLGLVLSAEQEAKLQAKVVQLLLAIEEQFRRTNKQGGQVPGLQVTKMETLLALAAQDPDLAALPSMTLLQRADAGLSALRGGLQPDRP